MQIIHSKSYNHLKFKLEIIIESSAILLSRNLFTLTLILDIPHLMSQSYF